MDLAEKLEAMLETTCEEGFYDYAEAEAVAAAVQDIARDVLGGEPLEFEKPAWWETEKKAKEG